MLYLLKFIDKPNSADIRTAHLEAHKTWLSNKTDRVVAAGSIRQDPDGAPIGGVWLISAESNTDAEAFYQTDPFWINGLRDSVEMVIWDKAFPDTDLAI